MRKMRNEAVIRIAILIAFFMVFKLLRYHKVRSLKFLALTLRT
jgi:hypothetical protein